MEQLWVKDKPDFDNLEADCSGYSNWKLTVGFRTKLYICWLNHSLLLLHMHQPFTFW